MTLVYLIHCHTQKIYSMSLSLGNHHDGVYLHSHEVSFSSQAIFMMWNTNVSPLTTLSIV